MGHKNGHLKVTWLKHFIMPFGMGECQFQHVLLHLEEYDDHPLKMNDKCRNDQCSTPQECEGNSLNHRREAKFARRIKKSDLTMS